MTPDELARFRADITPLEPFDEVWAVDAQDLLKHIDELEAEIERLHFELGQSR